MSIQDLQAIKANTNFTIANIDDETKEAAKQIETLFSQKFYNGGQTSSDFIQSEINRLQDYLNQKQEEMVQNYALLKMVNAQLNKLTDELNEEIYKVTQRADKSKEAQQDFIERAIDEVNQDYMDGKIEKSEMSTHLAQKISKYCCIDQEIVNASVRLTDKKSQINVLTAKMASIIDKANGLEQLSKLAQGTLVMMNNLKGKMSLGTSNSATAANERPIYTPTKQALVDELAQGIKGTAGGGDRNSMNNPQMVKLKEFLGLNGDGTVAANGVLADSMLQKMKEEGFTSKEALYAVAWIFDGSNINYTPGGQWSVPYGHGEDAHNTYAALIDQMKKLWGADAVQDGDVEDPTGGTTGGGAAGGTTGGTDVNPTDIPPEVVEQPKRTDPIGYAIGDTTYEFVIDKNNDGKFNGVNEFLGADNGINELKGLDTNGDGFIDTNELKRDDLFVLMTNHKTGEHSFMSAVDGNIKTIDLGSIQSKDWTNINDNKLSNVFTINTVSGGTTQGYQTLDSAFYLSKSYNGVTNNAEMSVKIDDEALNEAQNIFNSIKFMSNAENEEKAQTASNDTRNAQRYVDRVAADMEETYSSADSALNKGPRPETEAERKARIEEEIAKLEEEQRALERKIAALTSKDEEENKENVELTKAQKEAQELSNLRRSYRASMS